MAIDKLGGVCATGPAAALESPSRSFGKVMSEVASKSAAPVASRPEPSSRAAQLIDRVDEAQKRLDHVLELARNGRTFSAAELLAMQARVYQSSQELELAGRVVEKATAGVKQILQTQL